MTSDQIRYRNNELEALTNLLPAVWYMGQQLSVWDVIQLPQRPANNVPSFIHFPDLRLTIGAPSGNADVDAADHDDHTELGAYHFQLQVERY